MSARTCAALTSFALFAACNGLRPGREPSPSEGADPQSRAQQLAVTNPRCELQANPLGIGTTRPRFSWVVESERRGTRQAGYRILVASSELLLRGRDADLWDSGQVESDVCGEIQYAGRPLRSRTRSYWQVRVWDRDGRVADSARGWFETAQLEPGELCEPGELHAQWITGPAPGVARPASRPYATPATAATEAAPARLLQRRFVLDKPVLRARLYASALGLYEARLNGSKVSDDVLTPGWTDYAQVVPYQTYDVTASLRPGANVLAAILADGWYAGYVGWGRRRAHYGKDPALLAALVVDHTDGTQTVVASDASWRAGLGPWLAADLLMGEVYDARREVPGWDRPGDSVLPDAALLVDVKPGLRAQVGPAIQRMREVKAVSMLEPKPGVWVFDLGQNLVGWARLAVGAPAGTRVQMRFAEVTEPDGSLYTKNLRLATATDVYICKGEGLETFEPRFTFHGFRYVELTGLPERPDLAAVTGVVVHSAVRETLRFSCSEELVQRLHENIVWGMRGNFVGVPTDCPQRDERLGWMGDAQVFGPTACLLADAQGFFEKWLRDVVESQSKEGAFPDVVPRIAHLADGAPAWGDAGVIVPWTVWRAYGDRRVLELCYPAMCRWVQRTLAANPDLIWKNLVGQGYGDWLQVEAETPKELLATAYFARSAELTAKAAAVLGRLDEQRVFEELWSRIKTAFCAAFVAPDGTVLGDTQTGYALALRFALVPAQQRPSLEKRLARAIERRGNRLTTGFLGAGQLLPATSEAGRSDLAHALLLQQSFPSWLYTVKNGATTIWERWDGWRHDKGFQDPGMNSFNHYAFGAVGEWLYGHLAGITQEEGSAGWRRIVIRPEPGPGFTSAGVAFESKLGWIESRWQRGDEGLTLHVRIPVGASAIVHVPAPDAVRVREGGVPASTARGVRYLGYERGVARYEVGSGVYEFAAPVMR